MKRYGSEICAALLLAVVISCFGGVIVYASSAENQITDQMELTDLQSMVDEMLGEKTFSVTEAFHRLLSGEEVLSEESVREFLHSLLFYGIEREKELILKLLLLLLFAAVFSGFAGAFDNGQVGEISFYVVYLLVFTLLMNSFSGLSASLLSMLAWITEFMKELSPVQNAYRSSTLHKNSAHEIKQTMPPFLFALPLNRKDYIFDVTNIFYAIINISVYIWQFPRANISDIIAKTN